MFGGFIKLIHEETPAPASALSKVLPLLHEVSDAVNGAQKADTALQDCLGAICRFTKWPLGHIYTDTSQGVLASSKLWHLDETVSLSAIKAFLRDSEATEFQPGEGIVGRVFASGDAASIENVTKNTHFLRADAATSANLHGYFAFPVKLGAKSVAVMEFLSRDTACLDAETIELMAYVGEQVGRILQKQAEDRKLEEVRRQFEDNVKNVATTVAAASEQMRASAEVLTGNVDDSLSQGKTIFAATSSVDGNMAEISQSSEALVTGVCAVGEKASKSNNIAKAATETAARTSERFAALEDATDRIGHVVSLISDITRQTNLLALNATIEASRAGEAGKGFAVVAQEVKALAEQTERATGEISTQIAAIEAAKDETSTAMEEVVDVINGMRDIAGTISEKMDSQKEASLSIARLSHDAKLDSGCVLTHVQDVMAALKESERACEEVLSVSKELSQQSKVLTSNVDGFLSRLTSG